MVYNVTINVLEIFPMFYDIFERPPLCSHFNDRERSRRMFQARLLVYATSNGFLLVREADHTFRISLNRVCKKVVPCIRF